MFFSWLQASWNIILASAPWLLAGFLGAGIIHVLLPHTLIKAHLERPGFKSVFKASAFGIPLPLCSCSVIPVGIALRRQGASRGATASFFVSTPEIGVDSFFLSYVLLGPLLAINRIIAVLLSAVTTGVAIDFLTKGKGYERERKMFNTDTCCRDTDSLNQRRDVTTFKWYKMIKTFKLVLHFAYVKLFDDLAIVLSVGFLSAGFATVLVPENLFQNIDLGSFGMMLAALVAALPVYVCATSSTPLVAALLAKGLSPGAALVFLLAGPATNISTMLALHKELGRLALALYLGGITSIAILCGGLTNVLAEHFGNFVPDLLPQSDHSHSHSYTLWGLLLVVLLITSLSKRIVRKVAH